MDAASSSQYQLQAKIALLEDKLNLVSQHLQTNNIGDAAALESIKPSVKSVRDKCLQELQERWFSYKPPLCSFDEYSSYLNMFQRGEHDREAARQQDRARVAYEQELGKPAPEILQVAAAGFGFYHHEDLSASFNPPELAHEAATPFRGDRYITFSEDAAIAQCPLTFLPFKRPLRYSKTVSLTLLDNEICFFANTTIVNLHVTYKNLLRKSEATGLDRSQVMTLLKKFVEKFFPSFYFSVINLTDPTTVFRVCVSLIDSYDVLSKLDDILKSMKRPAGESIAQTFWNYYTLISTRLSYTQPGLTASALEAKAQRLSTNALRHYVSPDLRPLYDAFVSQQHRDGTEVTHQRCLTYIMEMEKTRPNLAPSSDLYYAPTEPAEVNMHHLRKFAKPGDTFLKSPDKIRNAALKKQREERAASSGSRSSSRASSRTPTPGPRPRSSSGSRGRHPVTSTPARPLRESRGRQTPTQSPIRPPDGPRFDVSPARKRDSDRGRKSDRNSRRSHRSPSATSFGSSKSRDSSSGPSRPHSRMSSRSRERFFTGAMRDMKKLNSRLAKAIDKACSKCGSFRHQSRDCQLYPNYCKTKCSCGYFHKESECNRHSFWRSSKSHTKN